MKRRHRMPFGAEVLEPSRTRFRLWAPSARDVSLVLAREAGTERVPMALAQGGWWERITPASAQTRYRYVIDGDQEVPDPASRFNPEDVLGPSEVVDPAAFEWDDGGWRGRPWDEAVLYELHVGTFSLEGTFAGVEARLDYLMELGVTAIELMPVADFPGKHGWGYDGVLPYAPDAAYGRPEALKRLIAAAHARGLMVLLDVVYNHFGPEGNFLHLYAPQFFTERHRTPWGAAIDFDGAHSRTVRDFFLHNALYWLEEFHVDGLRLDAVHAIVDRSEPDILVELAAAVRLGPGRERHVHLVLENDRNEARYLTRDRAGRAVHYDAQWNDDVHHAFHVLLTHESDGYYADYVAGATRHLGRCLAEGFAYQGEVSPFRDYSARGGPSGDLPPGAFVNFLQTHDQVGNRAVGERLTVLAEAPALRAATVALLLSPAPPMLFMGEEFGAVTPFLFFCDFGGDLATAVTEGRRREFVRFRRFTTQESREQIPDPNDPDTFARSKLDWACLGHVPHAQWLAFHRQLLVLRRQQLMPRLSGMTGRAGHYTVPGDGALDVKWRLGDGCLLRLILNLAHHAYPISELPSGTLLHCEPAAGQEELRSGRLNAFTAACWIEQAEAPP